MRIMEKKRTSRSHLSLTPETGTAKPPGFVKKFRRWSNQFGSSSKINSVPGAASSTSDLLDNPEQRESSSGGHFDNLTPNWGLGPLNQTQSLFDVSMQKSSKSKNAAISKSTSHLDNIGKMKKDAKNVRNKKFEQKKHSSISDPDVMRRSISYEPEEDNAIPPHSNYRRNEKFHKIFKNVPEMEKVLNYYSCALVSEILLHGVLYITDNYFGFYSNVFGHITKILIPVKKITDIKKQNTAMLIPNAIKILADTKKFTFTSLISRDATFRLMHKVWHHAIRPKVEPDSISTSSLSCSNADSERNDSPTGSTCETLDSPMINPQINIESPQMTSVFDMCLGILGVVFPVKKVIFGLKSSVISLSRLIFLYLSAAFLIFRLNTLHYRYGIYGSDNNDDEGQNYREVYRWQNQMHSAALGNLKDTLASQIEQLVEVRKSLETLKVVTSDASDTFQETLTDISGVVTASTT